MKNKNKDKKSLPERVKRKSPSQSTIKQLFALSGNVCAFPNCNNPLVESGGTVVGEICHIIAAEENGPRFNQQQMTNKERASFDNLMLLCPIHHAIIDSDENLYNASYLRKIKAEHENNFKKKDSIIQKLEDNFKKQDSYHNKFLYVIKGIKNKTDRIETLTHNANKKIEELIKKTTSSFNVDLTDFVHILTTGISENNIKILHSKIMCEQFPSYLRGVYRKEDAWVGPKDCTKDNCSFVAVAPDKISSEISTFLNDWNQLLIQKDILAIEDKVLKLAYLHHKFLRIHPFHDGNGRISRVIFIAQVFFLENRFITNPFNNKNEYYYALKEADNGDFNRLTRIIANGLN